MADKVLITGGAGYLGSVLVPLLLDEGYEVTVMDRLYFGEEPLAPVSDHPRFRLIKVDLSALESFSGIVQGFDHVIHLAGLSNDPSCDLDAKRTEEINFEATIELARRAARAGVRRFVFASSCSVYGSNPAPIVDEESEPQPVSLYAEMKAKAERELMLLPAPGMSVTSLRMATLYGLSPRMRFDLAVNLMVMNAVQNRVIHVLGGGQQWRPFLHVVDAARAFLTTLRAPTETVDHQVFNVGGDDENFRIGELATLVRDSLPDFEIAVQTVADDVDKRSYRVSFKKIREMLDFETQCDVSNGIVELARAIDGGALGDCSDTRFYTVRHLVDWAKRPVILGGDPVRHDFLPFAQPSIGYEEEQEVLDTLRSGWLTTGPKTKRLEQELAEYTGAKYAVAVSSCTAALHLSLAALRIGPGDEVITSPITFPATANVALHLGAKPVFADIDPRTLNIDPLQVERKITSRTRAIIPVHMAGQPVDMDAIFALARKYDIPVIEDAAHAIGAEYRGHNIGNLPGSAAACFSFYPIKNMTTAEGGAILTNDESLAERARLLSLHGISTDAWKRYSQEGTQHWETQMAGYKYNMTDIQAAIGLPQLKRLDSFIHARERFATLYREGLSDLPELEFLDCIPGVKHAWHLFVILLKLDSLELDRDGFVDALKQEHIATGIHFRSLHVQKFYRDTLGLARDDLPNAAAVSDRLLSLPLYPKMTDQDLQDVIAAVRKVVIAFRKAPGESQVPIGRELAPVR
jgi:dTDP-4-amino-4,6-dideoxygalactose transaminase/nucleoside-diphosphate-sugar epimerase